MTLSPDEPHLIEKTFPRAVDRLLTGMFYPKEAYEEEAEERYDLVSKAYLLMKRLHQPYQQILMMPISDRDKLFKIELELIKKEQEEQKEKG